MSDPFLGEIRIVGFNFPPRGWADCNGQLLPIAQNTALFSLLGTMYGGDGRTTFALPDLRGRAALHDGQGPGLSPHHQGGRGGAETTTLTVNNLPAHTHGIAQPATDGRITTNRPDGAVPAKGGSYSTGAAAESLAAFQSAGTGGGQPFNIAQPFLVVRFVIALQGIFPSRN